MRWLLWRARREPFLQLDPQDFHQVIEFKIQNELQARLDFGNSTCLLSALSYHGLTTQTPFEIWTALDRTAWAPRVKEPKLHVVRFSGTAMSAGIEKATIEGVSVRVYSVAKTVADCFKYRNKIGLDVAMEALWRYAKICRVANVMRPYLAMLA